MFVLVCYFFFDLNARNALPLFFHVYLSGVRVCFFFDLNARNQLCDDLEARCLIFFFRSASYRVHFFFDLNARNPPPAPRSPKTALTWSQECPKTAFTWSTHSLFFLRPQRTKPTPVSFRCLIPVVGPSTGLFSSSKSFS